MSEKTYWAVCHTTTWDRVELLLYNKRYNFWPIDVTKFDPRLILFKSRRAANRFIHKHCIYVPVRLVELTLESSIVHRHRNHKHDSWLHPIYTTRCPVKLTAFRRCFIP